MSTRSEGGIARHPIDVHAGRQLAAMRMGRGENQTDIARVLGLTFQQIQKYEKGSNRMSASVLFTLAQHFGVTTDTFFAGLDRSAASTPTQTAQGKLNTLGKYGIEMAEVMSHLSPQKQHALLVTARNFIPEQVAA